MQRYLPFQTTQIQFEFPPVFAIDESWNGNLVRQLLIPGFWTEVAVQEYTSHRVIGYVLTPVNSDEEPVLLILNSAKAPPGFSQVLRSHVFSLSNGSAIPLTVSRAIWVCHPSLSRVPETPVDYKRVAEGTFASWQDAFSFRTEDIIRNVKGLRVAQAGALHAILAHWAVSHEPATVVMPTGIGKTETMLSVLVAERCERLLVVVPTDALRTQISAKFLSLGLLKQLEVVTRTASYPIVGILNHRPKSVEEVDFFFNKCQVVVTTMSVAGQCPVDVQERTAEKCSHLFVDEAHHLGATTWRTFKQRFSSTLILQFTATPFREDGKTVEGKPIFNYPLKKAQEQGYFRPIRFCPVVEFDPRKRDAAIARKAVEQLRADYGLGHVVMARAGTIPRAEEIYTLYQRYQEFHPVRIHTGMGLKEREQTRREILSGEARIVVCVDMLGEGFDLPELKIAAFHDVRKSLAVTLQLAGRFTRARSDLGDPTFIANIADVQVKEELRKLYTQSPDWNHLLTQASAEAIQEEFDLWEFIEGFQRFPEEISLQNVRPAMSMVAYKTQCECWTPDNFSKGIRGFDTLDRVYHDINPTENTLVILTARKVLVDWALTEEIYTWAWDLYILFWDVGQKLLFIHGSSNRGFFKDLAVAVAGDDVEQVIGPPVFRCFAGVNRLRLQNVGLLEQLGRLIRYTMRAGSDVEPALTDAQKRNTIKSNIFGAGFENGSRVTIGCSYRGRIWARRTTDILALTKWCTQVGSKLLDETLDPDEILKGTLVPIAVSERPKRWPVTIEWPDIMYTDSETVFEFVLDSGEVLPLCQTSINLVNPSMDGELCFEIRAEEANAEFVLRLFERGGSKGFEVVQTGLIEAHVRHGTLQALPEFFYHHPPTIRFADGSSLEQGNLHVSISDCPPYAIDKIMAWDWSDVDIKRESQGVVKDANTVQAKVIRELQTRPFAVIFDDDGSGEAADVIAIAVEPNTIQVEFYHCKYSREATPGHRIDDLYEVCGQAQKCIRWVEKAEELFTHMLRRDPRSEKEVVATRFERGDQNELVTIREKSLMLRVQWKVYIVQPGLSKKEVSQAQLELLSVTENYLMETFMIPFGVIASP